MDACTQTDPVLLALCQLAAMDLSDVRNAALGIVGVGISIAVGFAGWTVVRRAFNVASRSGD